ncbi:penicillin acylase family protein [Robertkochia marina]|uniref:Penicillin acylase family protein n=1 Tax=Robertkochia marina TaxID=1227945 RepID=A0A4S3M2R3_9FLAO|nr:penicillin acylase family protein [Robertkochia marina]THD69160.1 penicillin acylase family protein [Robertkochia marina]TRZ47582.1 penicillin acylase family protein [Robertkochia marina]
MKFFKLLVLIALNAGIFYGLNTKFGSIPPLGKFLAPSQGVWQNESSETAEATLWLPGLSAPVTVQYDENLIPHVFAENKNDLYRAQGYITAQHRLWQMEFQTMASAGRLSEIFGEAALNYDRGQRRKGMVFGAEKALETMAEDTEIMEYLQAYSEGINAYISELNQADLPVEYKMLDYAPEPWTIKKTALLLMYMTDMLAGGDSDFEYTNALSLFGKERFNFLFPDYFDKIDPVIPKERDWSEWQVSIPDTPADSLALDQLAETMEKPHPDNGSNNWAVGPEKSYSGNPILANDPHLGLNLPSIWYVMQLATPEQNTFGATLPGALGIVIGFNDNIAWGVTNATRDVKDWYKITFKDDSKQEYLYDNTWKPTTLKVEEIRVRDGETYLDSVYYTHHGPVTYDETFISKRGGEGYAMKWTGHLGGNNQRTLLELNAAKDYEEYKAALTHFLAPAQNFVFASDQGDIALWIQGKFPNKWEGQGKFVMDGSNPEHEWQGFIPQEHNAHIKNPERGFVSSANQHPVDENYPYYVFNDGYDTYRSRVINEFFRNKEKVSIEDFQALHNNNYNLMAAELLPVMLDSMDTSTLTPEEMAIFENVKNWDFYNDIDDAGPSVFETWFDTLKPMLWDEFSNKDLALDRPFNFQTVRMLTEHPDDPFIDIEATPEKEDANDLFLASFKKAAAQIQEWSKEHGEYHWGPYKATYVGHLLQDLPAFSRFNLPIGGNSGIVNATSEDHGPSWRMIVELSDPPKAMGIYPGGQSGNPGSKHYDDFIDRWAAGEYLELEFVPYGEELTSKVSTQVLKNEE